MCSNQDTRCTTRESLFESRWEQEFFSSPSRPDRARGSKGRLFKRNGGRSFRVQSGLGVKLTIHAHLVPRLKTTAATCILLSTQSSQSDGKKI